jgi:hypothetical protein
MAFTTPSDFKICIQLGNENFWNTCQHYPGSNGINSPYYTRPFQKRLFRRTFEKKFYNATNFNPRAVYYFYALSWYLIYGSWGLYSFYKS